VAGLTVTPHSKTSAPPYQAAAIVIPESTISTLTASRRRLPGTGPNWFGMALNVVERLQVIG